MARLQVKSFAVNSAAVIHVPYLEQIIGYLCAFVPIVPIIEGFSDLHRRSAKVSYSLEVRSVIRNILNNRVERS